MTLDAQWRAAASLLVEQRDVLAFRPGDDAAHAGSPLEERGWTSFLLGLDDATLAELEIGGHDAAWPEHTPASLRAFVVDVRAACNVPLLAGEPLRAGAMAPAQRRETPRKRAQVEAFARLVVPLAASATRVIDVGSGHGHLTRAVAARLGMAVLGLERNALLAARARALTEDAAVVFAVTDVLRDGLALSDSDCVIGLHACGELGDAMTVAAARSGATIALVGCCLQKRREAARRPLHRAPGIASDEALALPRSLLGLSNLTARDEGVEASRQANLAARERRLALHRLLATVQPDLPLGAEIEGLNRRAAHRPLDDLVLRAFALRGHVSPSVPAIAEAAIWAARAHAQHRRLALPRGLLGRALEVFALLDRARHLETNGFDVRHGTLFPSSVSARNLALTARRS